MSAAERDTTRCTILRYEKRVATLRNTPPLWPFLLLLVVWLGGLDGCRAAHLCIEELL